MPEETLSKRIGFALTGSFCTFERALKTMEELVKSGNQVTPIFSFHAAGLDTRFGRADDFIRRAEDICGHRVIRTIQDAEPIGPKSMFDILVVAPCTGNTLAKLAASIIDTPVTMAVKSHLRNSRPVVLAVSTNDALGGAAQNIGALLHRRNYYFVPARQDNPEKKPTSVVACFEKIPETISAALEGRQIQPVLL
ncbi:MAG TPA: dipicolinate synthase subunit B [Firmicutes bacterium]|nr:dipicolinate synthase subunit B [Bacillota bacterium]